MSNIVRNSLIASLCMFILGILLIVIGCISGGLSLAKNLVTEGVDKLGIVNPHFIIPFGVDDMSFSLSFGELDSDYEIYSGDTELTNMFSMDEVSNLQMDFAAGTVTIEESENEYYALSGSGSGKYQFYEEDGTVYVNAVATGTEACHITLYIPRGEILEQAEFNFAAGEVEGRTMLQTDILKIASGAGIVNFSEVSANELECEVGAGDFSFDNATVKDCTFEVAAGKVCYTGIINGDVDVSCAAGDISLVLGGDKEAFNYDVSFAMGSVSIGDYEMDGLAQDYRFSNGADKNMVLEAAMGNIEVIFE